MAESCTVLRPPSDARNSLAELGSNLLEFGALSSRANNTLYRQMAERGIRFMHLQNPDQVACAGLWLLRGSLNRLGAAMR